MSVVGVIEAAAMDESAAAAADPAAAEAKEKPNLPSRSPFARLAYRACRNESCMMTCTSSSAYVPLHARCTSLASSESSFSSAFRAAFSARRRRVCSALADFESGGEEDTTGGEDEVRMSGDGFLPVARRESTAGVRSAPLLGEADGVRATAADWVRARGASSKETQPSSSSSPSSSLSSMIPMPPSSSLSPSSPSARARLRDGAEAAAAGMHEEEEAGGTSKLTRSL